MKPGKDIKSFFLKLLANILNDCQDLATNISDNQIEMTKPANRHDAIGEYGK